MIKFKHKGTFDKTIRFMDKAKRFDPVTILERYAKEGVSALSNNTPIDTGKTANSWNYEIVKTRSGYTIHWTNSHIVDGVPIAVIIQYGHGTGTGGYVYGIDYINPAIRPIFEQLANDAWKEITN